MERTLVRATFYYWVLSLMSRELLLSSQSLKTNCEPLATLSGYRAPLRAVYAGCRPAIALNDPVLDIGSPGLPALVTGLARRLPLKDERFRTA
jgi:hypothetical protein